MINKKLILSSACKIIKRDNRVVIVNTYNGRWYKLSQECYNILNFAIQKNLTEEALFSCLADSDDKIYFTGLLGELSNLNIINANDNNYEKITQIGFSITHRCNLSCTHCSVSASTIMDPEYMTTEQIKEIVDKLLLCNPNIISISGGEPLVRNDFFEIMDYIKKQFTKELTIMTNGLLINETNVAKLISYFNNFDISIDGVDEISCSKIRGKGTFDKIINSINLLKCHGANNIALSMVLTKNNQELIERFKELNRELGTKPVLRFFAPIGRGELNKENLSQEIIKREINITDKEHKIEEKIDCKNQKIMGYSCGAVRNQFHIYSNGDIYPCAAFQESGFELGNILEIKNIDTYFREKGYEDTEGYKRFLNTLPYNDPKCKDCDVNLFCITCPYHSHIHRLDDNFDEYCKVRKTMSSSIWEANNEKQNI